jgi:hypothetical protein
MKIGITPLPKQPGKSFRDESWLIGRDLEGFDGNLPPKTPNHMHAVRYLLGGARKKN